MNNPLILDIKGNSLDDGPGVRTVVFFKGCPLSCVWCHNPESKKTDVEISFSADECIGCNTCKSACTRGALSNSNPFYIDRKKCDLCFKCVDVCPAKALTRAGNPYTIDEIVERVMSDKPFYDVSDGGLTLSGGEVTLYPEFAGELLKRCKAQGVHTLIETCGLFNRNSFEREMLPYIDAVYFDLKIFDAEAHKLYCGADNRVILENFRFLADCARRGEITLLPRTPLIPNITDTDKNLTEIAKFLRETGIKHASLLPYNPTWYPKNARLGLENPPALENCKGWQTAEKIERCKKIFTDKGILV